MRTTLFFSALFAVALVGSTALAEKSARGVPDRLRARGDMVDKSYRGAAQDRVGVAKASSQQPSRGLLRNDRMSSRVSCSEMGVDCNVQRGAARAAAADAKITDGGVSRPSSPPAFMARFLGSDRTNINEAGEDQGMSTRAAKRAWSNAQTTVAGDAASRDVASRVGAEKQAAAGVPASGNRMACNEGGECSMSSKAAKKEWAYQSVRAGTWSGPDAKVKTPAERAIAEAKRQQKSDAQKR